MPGVVFRVLLTFRVEFGSLGLSDIGVSGQTVLGSGGRRAVPRGAF